jgi:ElaA protein
MAITWRWCRYPELQLDDLHDALALRARVFVVEQRCAYLDPDGLDRASAHLLGRDARGGLQAYLRVVDPGAKYAEPSIGRVITAPDARGTGLGRTLLAEGIARCRAAWPGQAIRIGAQAHLQAFYGGFGFVAEGAPYDEDGIPHIEMRLPA